MTSTDRILTTHTGSLPRPPGLVEALGLAGDEAADRETQDRLLRDAVAGVVARQVEAGIDTVSDGEQSKAGYSTYVTERLTGFGGSAHPLRAQQDTIDFPDWGEPLRAGIEAMLATPACIGDVAYADTALMERDVENLRRALGEHPGAEGFMTTASPGVISMFLENQHYPSHEDYLAALAATMRIEYEALHASGFLLQIDCPDLAVGRHVQFKDLSREEFKRTIELHVEALNDATRAIPPEAMRIHLCWGNYEGPHNHDVPLAEILPTVLKARPAQISFELANPRHEHEWRVFEDVDLPDDKVLVPGVIDSTTNYIEHPELVAERIVRLARLVGRERVIASTDCGFATFAAFAPVFPSIVYAKLGTLAEGAELATRELWS
jgi:5-methyltetrahydropteroyltriglutamate--homocysteine methyltransferase